MKPRILHPRTVEGRKRLSRFAIAAACVITVACAGLQAQDASTEQHVQESEAMHHAPQEKIEVALADAAQRLSLPRERIEIVSAERVTWADGSLGCPQPGMLYTQALVPGYRIVLRANGQTLNYHSSDRGHPAFCPAERVVTSAFVDDAR